MFDYHNDDNDINDNNDKVIIVVVDDDNDKVEENKNLRSLYQGLAICHHESQKILYKESLKHKLYLWDQVHVTYLKPRISYHSSWKRLSSKRKIPNFMTMAAATDT